MALALSSLVDSFLAVLGKSGAVALSASADPTLLAAALRLRQDRRLVAFMRCFGLGSTLFNKFVGFGCARSRDWRHYFRLRDAFIDLALSSGTSRVESGQTGCSGKPSVGHRLLTLTNDSHHANPLLRTIYRAVGSRFSWQSLDADLARHLMEPAGDRPPGGPPGQNPA